MKNKQIFLILIILMIGFALFLNHTKWTKNSGLKLTGTLELTEHSLGARTAGRLTALLVDEGDQVKEGQLIGTLDRYDQAKRDFDRAAKLLEQGGTTKQAVEQAELTLNDQQVVSPVDGVILIKIHEKGEVLSAGSPIVTIGDRRKLWVRIYVPEGSVNLVKMNQPATLHFDGLKETFKGHVSFIALLAEFTPRNVQTPEERVTQTFAVKVTLDNPESFLRPGVSADVDLET